MLLLASPALPPTATLKDDCVALCVVHQALLSAPPSQHQPNLVQPGLKLTAAQTRTRWPLAKDSSSNSSSSLWLSSAEVSGDGCASEVLQLRVSVQELAAAEREVADMMSDCLAMLLVSRGGRMGGMGGVGGGQGVGSGGGGDKAGWRPT